MRIPIVRFFLFLLICFSFSYCFAQINSIDYFYEGQCENPDFAALAVLESQRCPLPVPKYERFEDSFSEEHKEYYDWQTCTSRYRILRVLDAASDTLKKEYLEAKEKPVLPYYRHRPMLIFGKHKNGMIQIEGREETGEYFDNSNSWWESGMATQYIEFSTFLADSKEIYALHSIGTPYYNFKNLDRIDTMYYADYLLPRMKFEAEVAGKNFSELLLRLNYKRTPIKTVKIKNNFAALGTIKNVRIDGNSGQSKFYRVSLAIETVIKNDAKINSNTAIYMDKNYLPPDWICTHDDPEAKRPFYFFGDLKDGSLFIDSLVSTRDTFVFGDTLYDISMGIPFEELVSYFLPPDISIEELKFGNCWDDSYYFENLRNGIIPKSLASKPDSLIKAISEIAVKWVSIDNKLKQRRKTFIKENMGYPGDPFLSRFISYKKFRCGKDEWHLPPMTAEEYGQFMEDYYSRPCEHCKAKFTPKKYGVWGVW